ncbi:MAG: hypothetical protein AB4426_12905 [Xenococcaceae cyanobacterium]
MPTLPIFDPPANQSDFAPGSPKDKEFRQRWSEQINRWTNRAIRRSDTEYYFNPLTTDIPPDAPSPPISWIAFPNRINVIYSSASQPERWRYADQGPPNYPGPPGPRGWQDEYSEWIVTRNQDGKITKVAFTCENPEYWEMLWEIDKQKVLELYRELVSPEVQLDDLSTSTGRYGRVNKWNNATNGPVHLISPPNTLGAEIQLASDSTILRHDAEGNPVTDPDALIQCARFGTPGRNSDPHIGQQVNQLVLNPPHFRVTLKNPVGLYIQRPSFGLFELPRQAPSGAKPEDYWQIKRGVDGMILHATYEVPEDQGFAVGDISIGGFKIHYGAQIAEQFQVQLVGLGIPRGSIPEPQSESCVGSRFFG